MVCVQQEDAVHSAGYGWLYLVGFAGGAKHHMQEVMGLQNDPLFRLAKKLEKIALEDEYFVSKKLYPNVDFYSGIILKALGIPVEMFTVIFATGRTVGWISHWNEMITHPYRIGRPRQLYTGADVRDYKPVEDR